MVEAAEKRILQSEKGGKAKKQIFGFSCLRSLACIAVIVLHTVYSAVLLFGDTLNGTVYMLSMAVVNCLMWAVPCFIMVTGALLLNRYRNIPYEKLFGKYIFRIIAALVIFGMLFRIFDIIMDHEDMSVKAFLLGFYEIFTGTSWSHIWYLYLLIGLYLLLPFYKKIAENSEKNEVRYLLVVYLLFLSVLPVLQIWNVNCGFYIHVSTIYPFYLFFGYALFNTIVRFNKVLATALLVFGTVLLISFTVIRWKYQIPALETLWSYSSIFVVMQAGGGFSLLCEVKDNWTPWLKKIILMLDSCSFGIYLIHMIFVRLILRYMQFNPYESGGIGSFVVLILGILCVSWLIIWGLKKIPFLKRIL